MWDDKTIKLIVADNGIGINSMVKDEMFKMFKRVHEKSDGPGLGLYSVKLGLQKLNGKIKVNSASETGTEFHVTLPHLD